jgi:hypothetical protein
MHGRIDDIGVAIAFPDARRGVPDHRRNLYVDDGCHIMD